MFKILLFILLVVICCFPLLYFSYESWRESYKREKKWERIKSEEAKDSKKIHYNKYVFLSHCYDTLSSSKMPKNKYFYRDFFLISDDPDIGYEEKSKSFLLQLKKYERELFGGVLYIKRVDLSLLYKKENLLESMHFINHSIKSDKVFVYYQKEDGDIITTWTKVLPLNEVVFKEEYRTIKEEVLTPEEIKILRNTANFYGISFEDNKETVDIKV